MTRETKRTKNVRALQSAGHAPGQTDTVAAEPVQVVESAPATSKVLPMPVRERGVVEDECGICGYAPCTCSELAAEAAAETIERAKVREVLPPAETAPVSFTVFYKPEGATYAVRKTLKLDSNGDREAVAPDKVSDIRRDFWEGTAERKQATLGQLFVELQRPQPSNPAFGFLVAGVSEKFEKIVMGEHNRRSKDLFPFSPGPSLLTLDGDELAYWKLSAPADVVAAYRQLGVDADLITSSSASSYLRWPNGSTELRGLHTFASIDQGTAIPEVLVRLHKRSWLVGYGRILVGENGVLHVRSLVDTALKTSNQPIFEFGSELRDDQIKQARRVELHLGTRRQLRVADIPELTEAEEARFAELVEEAKRKAKPEAERVTEVWIEKRLEGVSVEHREARRAQLLADREKTHRDLADDFLVTLNNGATVSVADIKADRDRHHRMSIRDPYEPDYGTGKATIVTKEQTDGRPKILSRAHGQEIVYFLDEKPGRNQADEFAIWEDDGVLSRGSLIRTTDNGRWRLVASQAREQVLPALRDRFAQAPGAKVWHTWDGHHWRPEANDAAVNKALHDLIEIGCDDLGFDVRYVNSVRGMLEIGENLVLPEPVDRHAIPFRNGVLMSGTGEFIPVNPANGNIWFLPYEYDPAATCPRIYGFLLSAMSGDVEMVEYLRAVLAAILHGRADLQVFFYLIGPGGSGKSTFMRLAQALVGKHNTHTTDLKTLEGDAGRFETACCYGKRLLLLNDLDKWGGGLARLKALTGQDPLRYEEKHKQQRSGSGFIYEGMVLSASNEPLVSTDLTSGVIRRQRNVEFSCVVSDDEKARWKAMGGEGFVLHSEMPGLVNWLLGLSATEIEQLINNPPARAKRSNFEAMLENNRVARWLVQNCAPAPGHHAVVGVAQAYREGGTIRYENAQDHLYPSFLAFCAEDGVQTLSRGRFMSTLEDIARTLKHPVLQKQKPGANVKSFRDLRLLGEHEDRYRWDDSIEDDELKAVPDPFDELMK